MTERVTAYLCSEKCGNISITAYDADINAITETSTRVTASIQPSPLPAGCAIGTGKVTAPIIETGESKYCDLIEDDMLEWYRGYIGNELRDYININASNPDHCHWVRTEIWLNIAIGPRPVAELWGYSEVSSGGEAIPDNKADVFSGGGTPGWTVGQNLIVPGDLLTLAWRMHDGENEEIVYPDSKWWCTCCFTGGTVTEIAGDYEDEDIQYFVDIQGITRACVPSDFTEYEVGDWVFVHIPSSSCADRTRTVACKAAGTTASEEASDSNKMLTLVNEARATEGMGLLYFNNDLNTAATRHADDMAENQFLDHTGSDGSTPFDRIGDTGYLNGGGSTVVGENVAMLYGTVNDTVQTIFDAWMDSPGHRANILNSEFMEMGIASTVGLEYWYWCQTFGYNSEVGPVDEEEYWIILPLKIGDYGA